MRNTIEACTQDTLTYSCADSQRVTSVERSFMHKQLQTLANVELQHLQLPTGAKEH